MLFVKTFGILIIAVVLTTSIHTNRGIVNATAMDICSQNFNAQTSGVKLATNVTGTFTNNESTYDGTNSVWGKLYASAALAVMPPDTVNKGNYFQINTSMAYVSFASQTSGTVITDIRVKFPDDTSTKVVGFWLDNGNTTYKGPYITFDKSTLRAMNGASSTNLKYSLTPSNWYYIRVCTYMDGTNAKKFDVYYGTTLAELNNATNKVATNFSFNSSSCNAVSRLVFNPGSDSPANFDDIRIYQYTNNPTATATLSGISRVGQTLMGTYTYFSPTSSLENQTDWALIKADDIGFATNKVIVQSGKSNDFSTFTTSYKLTEADMSKYFRLEIIPKDLSGAMGTKINSEFIGAVLSANYENSKPTAQTVKISGTAYASQYLSGSYIYYDIDNDLEEGTTFEWLRSDSANGQYVPIVGETGKTYMTTSQDVNKYIKFRVTPRSNKDPKVGDPTESDSFGPVTTQRSINLFDFSNANSMNLVKTLDAVAEKINNSFVRITTPGTSGWNIVDFLPSSGEWSLNTYSQVQFNLYNSGTTSVKANCWIVATGWAAAPSSSVTLLPGEGKTVTVNLNSKYPDQTYMIDPAHSSVAQVIIENSTKTAGLKLDVKSIEAVGTATTDRTAYRLLVPKTTNDTPTAGKRVRQVNVDYAGTNVYHTLYLPTDWEVGKKYPVIVEYVGSQYFNSCYSTGMPENGNLGYGMSKGQGYIWLTLPFVSVDHTKNELSTWGDADATADYCVQAVKDICNNFGGDPSAVFITGFSRGAIAAGYIGLRNDTIADLWLGFHTVQHYDGDGWNGATLNDAKLIRGARIKGRSSFLTDNDIAVAREILGYYNAPATYVSSGLGYHADTMVLDDRQSSLDLRAWMADVIQNKYGTHSIKGRVFEKKGSGISGVRVQSGETHFAITDENGYYEIKSIVDSQRVVTANKEGKTLSAPQNITMNDSDILDINFYETDGFTMTERKFYKKVSDAETEITNTGLENGDIISKITVKNNQDQSKMAMYVAALFNKSTNKLISIKSEAYKLSPLETHTYALPLSVDGSTSGLEIRTFLFESISSLKPLELSAIFD